MLYQNVLLVLLFTSAGAQEEWEGKEIREVRAGKGWRRHRFVNFKTLLNAREGQVYTLEKRRQDYNTLFARGLFRDVKIRPEVDRGMLVVVVSVEEFDVIDQVEFRGHTVYSTAQLAAAVRLAPGLYFNPAHLELDRIALTDMHVSKGHHFFGLREEVRPTARGVHLVWHITEGPMVSVESIEFTGNKNVSASDLKGYMLTRENDYLLFIPTGKNPYIAKNLAEDITRIKLYYKLEGWLDIAKEEPRPRVFVEDLVFNETKTAVRIRIHIEEGERYKIRSVRVRGNTIYSEQEIRSWLESRPGGFYSEKTAYQDVQRIREKYGERAYILAEIAAEPIFGIAGRDVELLFDVKENSKVYVGKINIQGNTKTREDVIRRELTRAQFLPGQEYNSRSLSKGVQRLRNLGWFGLDPADPGQGVSVRNSPGVDPGSQDVTLDVKEGQTGNVRFAAGYSSAFGVLGIIEITQRNFDIADIPKSLADLIDGTGFAGGGQFLRLRFAPAVKRQTFGVEFKEPYFFGYELGFGLRAYSTATTRESYDEDRLGGVVFFEKPVDPFRFEIAFGGYQIGISEVDDTTPQNIRDLEGDNTVISTTFAMVFDTRNSPIFPSEGVKLLASFEYAGQELPGDFDFDKINVDSEFYWPIYETENKLRHVLSFQFTFGWAIPQRTDDTVPIFERYYAGGRGSIRGFEYRGMGPFENGDPVGGLAYLYASVEYTFPLFTKILRGAVFYDIANLVSDIDDFKHVKFRNVVGVGIRFQIPQLSNIPVAIDFGFPLTKLDDDEEELVTFDIGRMF